MNENLVEEIDFLRRTLRMADTQAKAVAWMHKAHELLGLAASEIDRPKIFSIPGHFGVPTLVVSTPNEIITRKHGSYMPPPAIWFKGYTTIYGDKYEKRAWTTKDTRNLESEIKRRKAVQTYPIQR